MISTIDNEPDAGATPPAPAVATPAQPAAPRQLPGCLPDGYTLDSMLTVQQFAIWQQLSEITVRRMLPSLPGFIKRSRENIRIHPRTYLERSVKHK